MHEFEMCDDFLHNFVDLLSNFAVIWLNHIMHVWYSCDHLHMIYHEYNAYMYCHMYLHEL